MAKRAGYVKTREAEFRSVLQAVKRDREAFIRRLQGLVHVDGEHIRCHAAHTKDGYARVTMSYFRTVQGTTGQKRKKISVYAHRLFLVLKLMRPIKLKHDAGHEPGCPHRDCVLHVFEQPMWMNCNTNGKDSPVPDCPF